jgi:hypothetical protein
MKNINTDLKSGQLANIWQVSQAQSINIIGHLEALGFKFEIDYYGTRLVPAELVNAVTELRKTDNSTKALESLIQKPELARYRKQTTVWLCSSIGLARWAVTFV